MGLGYRNLAASEAEFTRSYRSIKGVDFSATPDSIKQGRLPYIQNMYKNYAAGDCMLESVPGFRKLFKLSGRVHAIYSHRVSAAEEYILVHSGSKLYRFELQARDTGGELTPIATLRNTLSAGFQHGDDFYIFDGATIHAISKSGEVTELNDDTFSGYVPTTYRNLEPLEAPSLLSSKFKEEITLDPHQRFTMGDDRIFYALSADGKSAVVIGVSIDFSGVLHIPSSVKICGEYKPVSAIANNAFENNRQLVQVIANDGLKRVGKAAFKGCTNLTLVVMRDSISEIGIEAFSGCTALKRIYVGSSLRKIGDSAFAGCGVLSEIAYTGTAGEFSRIEGTSSLTVHITPGSPYHTTFIRLPIGTTRATITKIVSDGESLSFTTESVGGYHTAVQLIFGNASTFVGKKLTLYGHTNEMPEPVFDDDIRRGREEALFADGAAIKKCTKAVLFDGGIFLSGNPELPNAVFFSAKERPWYFSSRDYFCDGLAGFGVRSLLPAQGSLYVFTEGDDGGGSIFCHQRKERGGRVCYPAVLSNSMAPVLGDAFMFYDDPIFVSALGICGLKRNSIGGINAVCRSHNVNQKLLSEDFSAIRFTLWQGYLVVACGERMYLADSRGSFKHPSGEEEYEWFYLSGIGAPSSSEHKYAYHSIPNHDLQKHEREDEFTPSSSPVELEEAYEPVPGGRTYSVTVDGVKYHAYKCEELLIKSRHACTALLGLGELLFFGCTDGSLMLFNNDKLGTAPESLLQHPTYAADALGVYKHSLHPDFYDFAGYTPSYVIKTGLDTCDIPQLEKSTRPASVTVKLKSFRGGRARIKVNTDRCEDGESRGFATGEVCFAAISFKNFSFAGGGALTAVYYPSPKRWIGQEIEISSTELRSPIGIYSIDYRFKIKGRIKNR